MILLTLSLIWVKSIPRVRWMPRFCFLLPSLSPRHRPSFSSLQPVSSSFSHCILTSTFPPSHGRSSLTTSSTFSPTFIPTSYYSSPFLWNNLEPSPPTEPPPR
ncbi:hypothetical protein QBC33DRAFT_303617 [Phialemonium atrogriseum]|uniref:Uncharacterized protein n=1 Tax=Phialemonium atrogriseum TaxID=1093897 RepID=A0AAJ0C733_9PEZI|nr:uncharacterized protein QBC33DRAFT_303617 [Phialemonium atrogriseum]KAK1769879.1 hypothetical protein QBC33DRAFT_303617 [Phialemonium atrogriseum]